MMTHRSSFLFMLYNLHYQVQKEQMRKCFHSFKMSHYHLLLTFKTEDTIQMHRTGQIIIYLRDVDIEYS